MDATTQDMVQTGFDGVRSMLSVIIATHESERALVPTLAALVRGVAAGLVGEVVVVDAGSTDATAEVADIAGCRFVASSEPLGIRLRDAAASTRAPWLMFLRAGTVLEPGWVDVVGHFIEQADLNRAAQAAVFRPQATPSANGIAEVLAMMRNSFAAPRPEHGLVLARRHYEAIGAHEPHESADTALLRRIGRRRLARLGTRAAYRAYT